MPDDAKSMDQRADDLEHQMMKELENKIVTKSLLFQLADGLRTMNFGQGTGKQLLMGDDPRLPADTLDLVIMVDVYHELQDPQVFLQRLKPAFKAGGRLALLEFRKEDPKVPILEVHKMSVAEVKQEMEAEGYAIDRVTEGLPWQHLILIKVNDAK